MGGGTSVGNFIDALGDELGHTSREIKVDEELVRFSLRYCVGRWDIRAIPWMDNDCYINDVLCCQGHHSIY